MNLTGVSESRADGSSVCGEQQVCVCRPPPGRRFSVLGVAQRVAQMDYHILGPPVWSDRLKR